MPPLLEQPSRISTYTTPYAVRDVRLVPLSEIVSAEAKSNRIVSLWKAKDEEYGEESISVRCIGKGVG